WRGGGGGGGVRARGGMKCEGEAHPRAAPQRGPRSKLDAGDDRMQQTETAGGTVWGELGTAVVPAGDTSPRAGAAWFQVKPRLAGGMVAGGAVGLPGARRGGRDDVA